MLSDKQLKDVCLAWVNDHRCCRYLDDGDSKGNYYCLKQRVDDKKSIDESVNKFKLECLKNGIDPKSMNEPLGDNCQGYPLLKTVPQGYDV